MKKTLKELSIILFLIALAMIGGNYYKKKTPSELWTLVNDYREQEGLTKLDTNHTLCEFANTRAKEIMSDWSHDGWKEDKKYRKLFSSSGENLAKWSETENVGQAILGAWINSPTHKKILRGDYEYGCIGYRFWGNTWYVTLEVAND